MKLGPQRFDYWVHRFGFGALTGIDLPVEEQGIVLHESQYSGSSMGNLPMGQGESVTPIQMATAYSAIANGGILRPPRVVAAIGGKPTPAPAVIASRRPRPPRCATCCVACWPTAVPRRGRRSQGYDLAGKTGTANVVVNGSYSSSSYIASFIGFVVPASAPKPSVAVMVDEPQGSIYGGFGRRTGVPEDRRLGGA